MKHLRHYLELLLKLYHSIRRKHCKKYLSHHWELSIRLLLLHLDINAERIQED